MKLFQTIFFLVISLTSFSQIPKSGTYTYKFCDLEFNSFSSTCKVKIKGNKIWIYAPLGLTLIKEGELFEKGFLYKSTKGNWKIKNPKVKYEDDYVYSYINFKTRQFWCF